MQKDISITYYDAICNLGNNIDEMFFNAIKGDSKELKKNIFGIESYFGNVNVNLPDIEFEDFNTRCNQILLYLINNMGNALKNLFKKYEKNKIGIIVATTNTGVEEFSQKKNINYAQLGNPAQFLKKYLGLNGYCQSVSTACSSGIKAFSCAVKALNSGLIDVAIVAGSEALTKVPIYGFNSMEVLSNEKNLPFSENRKGINIGEGGAIFVLEKISNDLKIKGIGETTDAHHQTSPDKNGIQAQRAIITALEQANLKPNDIDYINLHGTGTIANDYMEANVINRIFGENTPASSTKSLTGHCLGVASLIETALCCHSIENQKIIPHFFDNNYSSDLPKINLATNNSDRIVKNAMCNAFGFGGTNAVLIIGKGDNNG